MKKAFFHWVMTAALLCGAVTFTACSSSDDDNKPDEPVEETLTPQQLAGLWVTDYAESGTEGDKAWTRMVEDFQFNADGTGYYECYQMDGSNFVAAEPVRDNGAIHFTIKDKTVNVTGDLMNRQWTLTYADGKLNNTQRHSFLKATAELQALVNQLYADWQGANSGNDDNNDNLDDVNGNVDVNNGGGGVNVVR
jgi:hypothetical protein